MMGFNIEIKARVDSLARLEPKLAGLGARSQGELVQEDVYFHSAKGRLKIRSTNECTPELIYYLRSDQPGPKGSSYQRWPLSDPAQMRTVMETVLGLRGVVQKKRTLYLLDNTRIHLDRVGGLGEFLELEVVLESQEQSGQGKETAQDLLHKLDIAEADLLSGSYIDLISATDREA